MANFLNLTPRELEILQLVIAGKSNKTIAVEIGISAKTVEFHLENMYKKIGVRNRLMAGVWAIQQGLSIETKKKSPASGLIFQPSSRIPVTIKG